MRAAKKKITTGESPIDLTRRLRREYFSQFNYDLEKIYKDLKESEKLYAHLLMDQKILLKKKKKKK